MPWYDYQCRDCKEVFSLQRQIAERDAPATCPKCESAQTRRRLSSFMTGVTGGNSNSGSQACGGFT